MRPRIFLSLLVPLLAGIAVYWAYRGAHRPGDVDANKAAQLKQAAQALCRRVPVPDNRGPDVVEGFRGEVHPLLRPHSELEVKAYWDCPDIGKLLPGHPAHLDPVRRLYREAHVAVAAQTYSARELSVFLPPEKVTSAGQLWAPDPGRAAHFLKQFHPAVSARSASVGRRPGPDGAFALLRGVSSRYLDIFFRIHAEFDLAPKNQGFPAMYVWYSPACFLGRILVNRQTGTIDSFQLSVPTDLVRNIHGTVWTLPDRDNPQGYGIYQFLRADRMELVGGNLPDLQEVRWQDQLTAAEAHDRLAKVFYKFKEIDFLPFPEALAAARARKKPIFAVVMLGALDDQSC